MAEVKIKIPDNLEEKMERFSSVDWSKKLEETIEQEIKRQTLLRLADKSFEKSELTEEDTLRLGREVKESLHEKFKEEHPEEYK